MWHVLLSHTCVIMGRAYNSPVTGRREQRLSYKRHEGEEREKVCTTVRMGMLTENNA